VKRFFNPVSLLQSLVALALVAGCLFAAQWQFSRGANQSATNKIIAANLDLPSLTMNEVENLDAVSNQWRKVTLQGSFSQDKQELVRNRYHEGKFGFEVLTLFTATNGENFWVDRGWVAAGPNAATPPTVEPVASGNLEIIARIRSENLSRQLQGSFFVTRATSEKPKSITKLQGVEANAYYLDLLGSPDGRVKPLTEIELPELSNGPHYAYGIQWLAFALLALIGRFLLFRETKRLSLVKVEI
jgi:cytochrome oxidase assembly protein ShyY1